jgi:hypothetical protein
MQAPLTAWAFNDLGCGLSFVGITPRTNTLHDCRLQVHPLFKPYFMERDFFWRRAPQMLARERIWLALARLSQEARLLLELLSVAAKSVVLNALLARCDEAATVVTDATIVDAPACRIAWIAWSLAHHSHSMIPCSSLMALEWNLIACIR